MSDERATKVLRVTVSATPEYLLHHEDEAEHAEDWGALLESFRFALESRMDRLRRSFDGGVLEIVSVEWEGRQ
jgi:hypothetical protein